jgi:hypothetical protein
MDIPGKPPDVLPMEIKKFQQIILPGGKQK